MNPRALLHGLIDLIPELVIPAVYKAVQAVLRGEPLEKALTQAERNVIAGAMQKSFDAMLDSSPRRD